MNKKIDLVQGLGLACGSTPKQQYRCGQETLETSCSKHMELQEYKIIKSLSSVNYAVGVVVVLSSDPLEQCYDKSWCLSRAL